MGAKDTIRLGVTTKTPITLPRGQSKDLKADFVINDELRAPIKKGDKVGQLHYSIDDKQVATYDLVALETVEKGGFFSRLMDYVKLLFIGWFA